MPVALPKRTHDKIISAISEKMRVMAYVGKNENMMTVQSDPIQHHDNNKLDKHLSRMSEQVLQRLGSRIEGDMHKMAANVQVSLHTAVSKVNKSLKATCIIIRMQSTAHGLNSDEFEQIKAPARTRKKKSETTEKEKPAEEVKGDDA